MRLGQIAALALACAAPALAATFDASAWTALSINKELELHGSVAQAIVTHTVKPSSAASAALRPYFLAFSVEEYERISYIDAVLDGGEGKFAALQLKEEGLDPEDSTSRLFSLLLPPDVARSGEALNLQVRASFNHLTEPMPKQVGQKDSQFLFWQGDVGVRSPYKTEKGRVKVM